MSIVDSSANYHHLARCQPLGSKAPDYDPGPGCGRRAADCVALSQASAALQWRARPRRMARQQRGLLKTLHRPVREASFGCDQCQQWRKSQTERARDASAATRGGDRVSTSPTVSWGGSPKQGWHESSRSSLSTAGRRLRGIRPSNHRQGDLLLRLAEPMLLQAVSSRPQEPRARVPTPPTGRH